MKRTHLVGIIAVAAGALLVSVFSLQSLRSAPMGEPADVARRPVISPDYCDLVIPPNIAPLNFVIKEQGTRFRTSITPDQGEPIEIDSQTPAVSIPLGPWKAMLEANQGGEFRIQVALQQASGQWNRLEPLSNRIARQPIDGFLLYRFIDPVFRCWGHMDIRQRELSSFDETCIVRNRSLHYDCVNCHSVSSGSTPAMAFHVRSQRLGARMLMARDDKVVKINTGTDFNSSPAAYMAWHPNGRVVAFAAIRVIQFFHSTGETRDVFDKSSDLGLYLVDTNTVTTTPAIARQDQMETYPHWSADGKWLYYCSAPQLPVEQFREVHYDLMRIAYDPEAGTWGEPETLLAAKDSGKSVTHPRISPDGRFLLFCLCDYGNFSIYHPESDLYMMDMTTRQYQRLAINSDDRSDSYHSWSKDGRWFVFSSKRRDGLFTHPYISHVDENGQVSKPFILPQENPAFYETCLKVFNVPELITQGMEHYSDEFLQALTSTSEAVKAELDPQVTIRNAASGPSVPWRAPR